LAKPEFEILDIDSIIGEAPLFSPDPPPPPPGRPPNMRGRGHARPVYFLPAGFENLALGRPVTTNVEKDAMLHAPLSVITDGNTQRKRENYFVGLLNYGETPYVQVDLGRISKIYCIGVWHYFWGRLIYTDVIVQIADDEKFTKNVRTLFNNDHDNSAKLKNLDRKPIDWHYGASRFGELIPKKKDLRPEGFYARFVRVYSDHTYYTEDEARFVEIMVWGKPE